MTAVPRFGEFRCPGCRKIIRLDIIRCPHCHAVLGEGVDAPTGAPSRSRWLFVLTGGAFLLLMTFADLRTGSVASANPRITTVTSEISTRHADVSVNLPESASSKMIPNAAAVLEDVGRAVKTGATDIPEAVETISVAYSIHAAGGGEGPEQLLELTVNAADLRQANYDALPAYALLDMAYDVRPGGAAGQEAMTAFCRDHMAGNPQFCRH